MKKLFIFMMCLMLSVSLTGCGLKEKVVKTAVEYERVREEQESQKRFIVVPSEDSETIIVDKETRVQYLYCGNGYGGGMTVLVGPDGEPLLYEGELE